MQRLGYEDPEKSEVPEDAIEAFLLEQNIKTGKNIMFDERGNYISDPNILAGILKDVFIFVPECMQVVRIADFFGPIKRSKPVYITCRRDGENSAWELPVFYCNNQNWYIDLDVARQYMDLDEDTCGNELPINSNDWEVIAWRPMLEPYKE